MQISYRKLLPSDSETYRSVRIESLEKFPSSFGASATEESKLSKLRFQTFIEQQLPDKFMIGAFDNQQLIGICGFIREEQKRSNHRGIVLQMYVKADYKGKNVGYSLLKTLAEQAFQLEGLEMLTLGLIANNKAALTVYEQIGFKEYGFMANFYKEYGIYDDHLFMVLTKANLQQSR